MKKTKKQLDPVEREYLSMEGFNELKEKLQLLKTKRRVEIAERLEYAKSLGDLSENAEYAEAKDEQMTNETEIVNLEDLLARAEVISKHPSGDTVKIGATVLCQKDASPTIQKFMIVGREEADPTNGKISHESPLGRSFLGRRKTETVLVTTPRGDVEYHIVDIA